MPDAAVTAASRPSLPRHVAIIMDGNGRWATARHRPRVYGHSRGFDAVRTVVETCGRRGVPYLTLFAFSSENWRRPPDEVSTLMRLFMTALQREVGKLVENGVRLRIAGERADFDPELRAAMHTAEARTAHNSRLNLTVCAGYGGRWDIVQALRSAVRAEPQCLTMPERIDEELVGRHLALSFAPDLDLLIRSGGEQRISNFLLWQAAYAELYFTEVLWPDFDAAAFDAALEWYAGRERRFGRTSAQVADAA